MKKTVLLLLFISAYCTRAQQNLWGMTINSVNSFGTIYNVQTGGNTVNTPYVFPYTSPGTDPMHGALVQLPNGKMYGMAYQGGTNNAGVIFQYDAVTNIYTKKFDFSTTAGVYPCGSLLLASNGMLYGMTANGGANNGGAIFEFNPVTDTYTKKFDFTSTSGNNPNGSLIQATNGRLYGLTSYGGTNNAGTLFEFNLTTNVFTKHVDFNGALIGSVPLGSLMQATDGFIYGTTGYGGASGNGILFRFDPVSNSFVKKYTFNGTASTAKGSLPYCNLTEAPNGKLYGMTKTGGVNNFGVLFEYNPVNDSLFKKLDFNGTNGKWPLGSLMIANNGNLYGLTWQGGTSNQGLLFEYNPTTNTQVIKFNFNGVVSGELPYGVLMQASNNKLYGCTNSGGLINKGTLFEYDLTNNTFTNKIDFNAHKQGGNPFGALLLANNNLLYGLTTSGGATNKGVLFQFDYLTNTYTKNFDFDGVSNGQNPYGALTQASNNNLYGLTYQGGATNGGVIFEYNISTNTFTKKIDLNATTGSNPYGDLFEASNNLMYGLSVLGGTNSAGTLFEYDPVANTCTKKIDFNGTGNGSNPQGTLMQASNGKLYGMTSAGGTANFGTLFEYNIATNTLTKKVDFTGTANGRNPYGDLVEASNGKLYGLTYVGGANNKGVLFEFNPSNDTYTKKVDFAGTSNGSAPEGRLVVSSNGKLYGTTSYGGVNGTGVLFEFNPANDNFTKLIDYGNDSPSTDLIEFCQFPFSASAITGTSVFCSGTNSLSYSTNTVQGASSYSWTVPATVSITAGVNTTTITPDFSMLPGGVYTVSVAGSNVCGNGVSSQLVFTVNALPSVSVSTSNSLLCSGQSATLTAGGAQSYTWSTSSNATSVVVMPTSTSVYTLTGVDVNGCESVASFTQAVSLCTDIKESVTADNLIHVYPNPSEGTFFVSVNSSHVYVYNVIGECVKVLTLPSGKTIVDLSTEPSGIYFLKTDTVSSPAIKLIKY